MYDDGLDIEEINQRSEGGGGPSQHDMFAQMFRGGRWFWAPQIIHILFIYIL